MTTTALEDLTDHPTVFVVDDDKPMRELVKNLAERIQIRAEGFASAEDFIKSHDPSRAGCLLLDVCMPGIGGLALLESLSERKIHLPVIMLTGAGDIPMALRAVRAGAVDFIQKPFNAIALIDRIQQAIALDKHQREGRRYVQSVDACLGLLTPSERKVLELIMEGKSTKSIAALLGKSNKTIEGHRTRIMDKMRAENLADLARMVLKREQILSQIHPKMV